MKIYDTLKRARRSLAQAKVRTVLTSLAIAVGTFTVTLALAAGAGGRQYTEDIIKTSGDAQSLSVYAKAPQKNNQGLEEYGASKTTTDSSAGYLNKTDIKKIESVAGVSSVVPAYDIQSNYITRGQGFKKYIAPVNIKIDKTDMELSAGSLNDNTVPDGGLIISEEYLASLGFGNANQAIGQTITINFPNQTSDGVAPDASMDKTFKITAVDRKSDATLYYQPSLKISIADGKIIHDYQVGDKTDDKYVQLVVAVDKNAAISTVQKNIVDKNYDVYSLQDIRSQLLELVNIAQWGMVAFGALAILASIFGIINTQYISVLERTQQIGLMKALGMRKKDVARLFRFEAAWVGLLGGIIGTIAALAAGLANPFISETLKLEKNVELLVFEPLTSVILISLMIFIAITAGFFPSRKAAKLDPIEALRTE